MADAYLEELKTLLNDASTDATFNEDRRWFRAWPNRFIRARLATEEEIAALHSTGAWPRGWVCDDGCWCYAIIKFTPPDKLEVFYMVLPPPTMEPTDLELQRMWRNAEAACGGPAVING